MYYGCLILTLDSAERLFLKPKDVRLLAVTNTTATLGMSTFLSYIHLSGSFKSSARTRWGLDTYSMICPTFIKTKGEWTKSQLSKDLWFLQNQWEDHWEHPSTYIAEFDKGKFSRGKHYEVKCVNATLPEPSCLDPALGVSVTGTFPKSKFKALNITETVTGLSPDQKYFCFFSVKAGLAEKCSDPVPVQTLPEPEPEPPQKKWFIGDLRESCDTVCTNNGGTCNQDANRQIIDRTTYDFVLVTILGKTPRTGDNPNTLTDGPALGVNTNLVRGQISICSAFSADFQRICCCGTLEECPVA